MNKSFENVDFALQNGRNEQAVSGLMARGGGGGWKVESIFAPLRAPSTERGCSQATKHFGNRPFWKRWRGDNHVISVVQIYPD